MILYICHVIVYRLWTCKSCYCVPISLLLLTVCVLMYGSNWCILWFPVRCTTTVWTCGVLAACWPVWSFRKSPSSMARTIMTRYPTNYNHSTDVPFLLSPPNFSLTTTQLIQPNVTTNLCNLNLSHSMITLTVFPLYLFSNGGPLLLNRCQHSNFLFYFSFFENTFRDGKLFQCKLKTRYNN